MAFKIPKEYAEREKETLRFSPPEKLKDLANIINPKENPIK